MFTQSADVGLNHLLRDLPEAEQTHLLEHLVKVDLHFGEVLCNADQVYTKVYFPLTGMISLVASVDEEAPLELGMIGSEGMLGATLLLAVDESPLRAVVQADGVAMSLPASVLKQLIVDCPVFTLRLKRYLYVLMHQLNHSTACTHFHQVNERLVRWLLMAHDRTPANNLMLTQQFLADMLGVQRSAISIAAGALQERELISYSRGEIKVLNREGLEAASCGCYSVIAKKAADIA